MPILGVYAQVILAVCVEGLCAALACMAAPITGASFREDLNVRLMDRSGNRAMERRVWEGCDSTGTRFDG